MRFYHWTTRANADSILRNGFRDGTGNYLTADQRFTGVWLSDRPLDINETGTAGDCHLILEMPASLVEPNEWGEGEMGYREFLVPANVINAYAKVSLKED